MQMVFSLTFESVYYAERQIAEPPADLRAAAELQIEWLHPERTHVLSTRDGRAFARTPLASSQGWYVTYTPKPADADNPPCGECGAVYPEPHADDCTNRGNANHGKTCVVCGGAIDAEQPTSFCGPECARVEVRDAIVILRYLATDHFRGVLTIGACWLLNAALHLEGRTPEHRAPDVVGKNFYEQANIGTAKYCVNFHDGIQTHADGSPFYGTRIFKNKKLKNAFVRTLISEGYEAR
jgi:hypothetical protein